MRAPDRRLDRTGRPGCAARQTPGHQGPELPRLAVVRQAMTAGDRTWAVQPAEIAALLGIAGNGAATAILAAPSRPSTADDVVTGPGRPLDHGVRAEMETRLAADLSAVRVHTDRAADTSARSMNAVAYTAGSHVVFQTGRYDPSSAPGRRLLAHELVHVVQQRRGPVAGTDAGGGIAVSDPHDRFEREADEVAAEALRTPAAPGPEHAGPAVHTAGTGGAPVVQRKVGFEFETGWLVQQQGLLGPPHWLKRKQRVGGTTFDGFKIEADEADGTTELEFIVYPPVEEGADGRQRLDQIMTGMTVTGGKLEGIARNATAPFALSAMTGGSADGSYLITPTKDLRIEGRPQVTSGLDLAKIGQLDTVPPGRSAAPPELQPSLKTLGISARNARTGAAAEGRQISPPLQGLVAVITNYLEGGAAQPGQESLTARDRFALALDYPKVIGNILLARTDFAALFGLLPPREVTYYSEHPQNFVRLVVASLDKRYRIRESDPIFAKGVKVDEADEAKGIVVPDLTVGSWLYEIPRGADVLRTVKDADSLGEFGSKTEAIGSSRTRYGTNERVRAEAGIFEFRGAQNERLPLNRWKPFALEFQQFISDVHR